MSKRFLSILIAVFLLIASGGICFAEAPGTQNLVYFNGSGGATGLTPPTKVIKVRYARTDANYPSLSSGDVVVWDSGSTDSAKLPVISGCIANNAISYAGVLVTSIATNDGTGYIATEGYVLAKVDTSNSATGTRLVTGGVDLANALGSAGTVDGGILISNDVGFLLTDTGSDGLMPVWLD